MPRNTDGAEGLPNNLQDSLLAAMKARIGAEAAAFARIESKSDPAAIIQNLKIVEAFARAGQAVEAYEAAAEKSLNAKRERLLRLAVQMDEMKMDDPDYDLDKRTAELHARYDHLMALLERKRAERNAERSAGGDLAKRPVEGDRGLAGDGEPLAA